MPEHVLRVCVVDDEPLARAATRAVVESLSGCECVGEAGDGLAAIELLEAQRPDLVLLDVQMPGCDGFDVLAAIEPEQRPTVVFLTAYDQYALRAFEEHAIDYVLKPWDDERLVAAIDRAKTWVGSRGDWVDDVRPHERFIVKHGERRRVVEASEVEWIEARGNYVMLHHGDDESLYRSTLTALEKTLDPKRFVRTHRSALVALSAVREIAKRPSGDPEVRLGSGTRVPLGRSHRAEFEQRLTAFLEG